MHGIQNPTQDKLMKKMSIVGSMLYNKCASVQHQFPTQNLWRTEGGMPDLASNC